MKKLIYTTTLILVSFFWLSLNASAAEFGIGIDFPHTLPSQYLSGIVSSEHSDSQSLIELETKLQAAIQAAKNLKDPRIKSELIQSDISKLLENIQQLRNELQTLH